MMPRTRNFVLFLGALMFLVSGITITLWRDLGIGAVNSAAVAMFVPEPPPEVTAAVPEEAVDERSTRLALLREKIAEQAISSQPDESLVLETEEPEEPTEIPIAEAPSETTVGGDGGLVCGDPTTIAGSGFVGVYFKETLGQRALVRPVDDMPLTSSTTSSSTVALPTEIAVLTLPLRLFPLPTPSCVASDVVGIALDGSFIRNDEHAVYGIFTADTLLGYALDGFPIYGTNNDLALDNCGGAVIGGNYRYYLSSARDAVINCYAGVPVAL